MRVHVVYDDQGTILAAAEVPVEGQDEDQMPPEADEYAASFDVPLPERGEAAAEFDVPTEFAEQGLMELMAHLQVDVQEHRLVERR
jgi:hypothetical protein